MSPNFPLLQMSLANGLRYRAAETPERSKFERILEHTHTGGLASMWLLLLGVISFNATIPLLLVFLAFTGGSRLILKSSFRIPIFCYSFPYVSQRTNYPKSSFDVIRRSLPVEIRPPR
jgi:hypothetical protein